MEAYTSTDAKTMFGEILMKSQAEPISVTKNGKRVAVVISENEYQNMKLQALRAALIDGENSENAGKLDMQKIKEKARKAVKLNV